MTERGCGGLRRWERGLGSTVARYPRRGAGMTDLARAGLAEVVRTGVVELFCVGVERG